MVTIEAGRDILTLVNVFTVRPERQQQLIDLLADATRTMKQLPGFVSANLHKSYDGKYVVNYVQWRSREDYEAMLHNPEATPHMKTAADLADGYNPITCEVSESMTA